MSNQNLVIFSKYLSVHALHSVLRVTHGNLDQTFELYMWNAQISAEVFISNYRREKIAHH